MVLDFSLVNEAQAVDTTVSTALGNVLRPIITNIVDPILLLLFSVAVVVFVYSVLQLVLKPNDADARDNAKRSMMYGAIGMAIMLSAWGIVNFVANTVKGFNQ